MYNGFLKKLTPEQAFAKAKHYCAYQERSHAAVKEKLYSYGLRKIDVEVLLARLIEEDYLNEERFAKQFAGGKFRMKKWGKKKIEYELKLKKVSPYNIKIALREIDNDQYHKLVQKLASDKWKSLENEHYLVRQSKTQQYLLQKGFELALIQIALRELKQ